jgi:hypothetical protein
MLPQKVFRLTQIVKCNILWKEYPMPKINNGLTTTQIDF